MAGAKYKDVKYWITIRYLNVLKRFQSINSLISSIKKSVRAFFLYPNSYPQITLILS
jgi:hypothetical protein